MRIKISYSMGYAGTDTEWIEDIPQEVVAEGQEALDKYIGEIMDGVWDEAIQKISTGYRIIE